MLALLLASVLADDPPEVREQIDWQAHPAMHLPWPMFRRGLTGRTPSLTWRHTFRQTVHEPYLSESGVRLFLAAAMAAERARSPRQARRLILRQLAYVEDFVAAHPDRYALATTPEQARELLATTDKIVVIHSIEGGRKILTEPGDAAFWAEQGVALVTLIHLYDDELGGAALLPGAMGVAINRKANRKRRRGVDRSLTERGREALVELDEAGILVDLTHASQQAIDESLELMAEHGIPPVVTHGQLDLIRTSERSFSAAQIERIYRLGGTFNLALSGDALRAHHPVLDVPDEVCDGTLESFAFHVQQTQDLLDRIGPALFDVEDADALSDEQRTLLATGWSSDWNGWVNHSRPTHGPGGCYPASEATHELDTAGLAHPGMLPVHWERVAAQGVDLDPMLRSAERFLQLWEEVRADRPEGGE